MLLAVFLIQEGNRHKFYSNISQQLKETGQKTFVTEPIFEFMGLEYDIIPQRNKKNILTYKNSKVMFLRAGIVESLDIPQMPEPDRIIMANNRFILQPYQSWYLYLPDQLKPWKSAIGLDNK